MRLKWNGSSKENTQIQGQRKLTLSDRSQTELRRFPYPQMGDSVHAKRLPFQLERTCEHLHWHGLIEENGTAAERGNIHLQISTLCPPLLQI